MTKEIAMYDGQIMGISVSEYGKENGYLDYRTLARLVEDCILCNNLMTETDYWDWKLVNGCETDEDRYNDVEIYQYYIISHHGYQILSRYTDEIVYYHEKLDLYLWGITHFGTSWDYVLTDVKLVRKEYV